MFSKKIMCDKNYELLTWVIHAVFISHESCLFCLNKGGRESYHLCSINEE